MENVSLPASVATVPLKGKVKLVTPTVVNVTLLPPQVRTPALLAPEPPRVPDNKASELMTPEPSLMITWFAVPLANLERAIPAAASTFTSVIYPMVGTPVVVANLITLSAFPTTVTKLAPDRLEMVLAVASIVLLVKVCVAALLVSS